MGMTKDVKMAPNSDHRARLFNNAQLQSAVAPPAACASNAMMRRATFSRPSLCRYLPVSSRDAFKFSNVNFISLYTYMPHKL